MRVVWQASTGLAAINPATTTVPPIAYAAFALAQICELVPRRVQTAPDEAVGHEQTRQPPRIAWLSAGLRRPAQLPARPSRLHKSLAQLLSDCGEVAIFVSSLLKGKSCFSCWAGLAAHRRYPLLPTTLAVTVPTWQIALLKFAPRGNPGSVGGWLGLLPRGVWFAVDGRLCGGWVAISGIDGLDHLAVQYGKAIGFHVIAVGVDDAKLTLATRLGADATDLRPVLNAKTVRGSIVGTRKDL